MCVKNCASYRAHKNSHQIIRETDNNEINSTLIRRHHKNSVTRYDTDCQGVTGRLPICGVVNQLTAIALVLKTRCNRRSNQPHRSPHYYSFPVRFLEVAYSGPDERRSHHLRVQYFLSQRRLHTKRTGEMPTPMFKA